MKYPFRKFRISWPYGTNNGKHKGLDCVTLDGNIRAIAGGLVQYAGNGGDGFGIYVKIKQNDGLTSYYAHCKQVFARAGQTVSEGQEIAEMGSTGNVTGAHLHLEIRKTGTRNTINPADYLGIENKDESIWEEQVAQDNTFWVRVDKENAAVRAEAHSKGKKAGSMNLYKGNTFEATGTVIGEPVNGNNIWYRSKKGNYVWSGGLRRM